jgi:hypothetical protein
MSGIETAIIGGVLSAGMSAISTIAGGAAQNKQAKYQARVLQQQADQEKASANREAQKKRSETEFLMSRQQALAAASGGGASDPTILDLMGDTAAEGEVQAKEVQYGGDVRATDLQNQASFIRHRGKAAKSGAMMTAMGTIAGSGLSLAGKYGDFGSSSSTYSGGGSKVTDDLYNYSRRR